MKHEEISRTKEDMLGDFWLYKIICSCGEECGGWSPQEAEAEFKEHLKEKKK